MCIHTGTDQFRVVKKSIMVPSNESTQKPKPPTPTPQHQQQPCSSSSSSLPQLMSTTNDAPHPIPLLPNLNSPPPDHAVHQEIAAAQGSTSNGDKRGREALLNGEIDDTAAYFLGLLPAECYTSAKHTKTYHYDYDPKGKRKVVIDISSSESDDDDEDDGGHRKKRDPLIEIDFLLNFENNRNSDGDGDYPALDDNVADDPVPNVNVLVRNDWGQEYRKKRAARFACPSPKVPSSPVPQVVEQQHDEIDGSLTPFSLAIKAIQDRITKSTKRGCVVPEPIAWVSKRKNKENVGTRFPVPSLVELSLKILANHADAIVSLDGVPNELRHRLSRLLCDSRKVNGRFVEELLRGSPTDVRLTDCSWLTEEQFTESFRTCDTARLQVLQLDQCGRCIADYTLLSTLAQSPKCLPRLINLSLSGACRLTDKGLHLLLPSVPVLRSINLSQCSLLTSASLNILADSLGSLLKELYLDNCLLIDAALIVPALKRLEHLEVLSLAGIQTVCDEFTKDYIIASGHNIKELVLRDCIKLTDASVKVIAEHCPGLHALDLMNLGKLTDLSLGYLTNSSRALHTLNLRRNPFSDEAIAAFLETTGESLTELSLNNIRKVGQQTTLSLAGHAKNLHTLDLSWCRNLTDNDFGFIVDSCSSLRLLKLFGCTQVTDVFLEGHSNPKLQITGSKLSLLLQHINEPPPHQGALRYSSALVDFDIN